MRDNDIYGHVIHNAKDVQVLYNNFEIQKRINKNSREAGILTCVSVILLGAVTWVISNAVDNLQKRVDELENERKTIDIHPEE